MTETLNRAPTGDSARGPGVDETPGPHPLTRRRPESSTSAHTTPASRLVQIPAVSEVRRQLREHHALGISRETVRRYREQLGHPPKRARRAPRVRRRRVPSAARGALIQIDGSPFPWLEDRGPELMLLGAIDDATSEILALPFR